MVSRSQFWPHTSSQAAFPAAVSVVLHGAVGLHAGKIAHHHHHPPGCTIFTPHWSFSQFCVCALLEWKYARRGARWKMFAIFCVKIKNMKIQPKYLLNSNEKKINDFFSVYPCYARSRLNVTLTCTHTNKHCVQWLRYGGHTGCLPAARVLILRGFAVCFLTMGMCVLSTW